MKSQEPEPDTRQQEPEPDTRSQGPGPDTKSQEPGADRAPDRLPDRARDTEPGSMGQICRTPRHRSLHDICDVWHPRWNRIRRAQ
jgi:hypothetical protein